MSILVRLSAWVKGKSMSDLSVFRPLSLRMVRALPVSLWVHCIVMMFSVSVFWVVVRARGC